MFRLHNVLKAPAVLAAALLCSGLAAQQKFPVAIAEATGDAGNGIKKAVTNRFVTVLTGRGAQGMGFTVAQRDEKRVESAKIEVGRKNDGDYDPTTAVEEGKGLLARFEVSTDMTVFGNEILVSCQITDLEKRTNAGSADGTLRLTDGAAVIQAAAEKLMTDLLKQAQIHLSEYGSSASSGPLEGLEEDLLRVMRGYNGTAKWNSLKASLKANVGPGPLKLTRDLSYNLGTRYRVTGGVEFSLAGATSFVEIEPFTESNPELLRKKIIDQVRPKVSIVATELLSQFQ